MAKTLIFNGFNTAGRIPKLEVAGLIPVSSSRQVEQIK